MPVGAKGGWKRRVSRETLLALGLMLVLCIALVPFGSTGRFAQPVAMLAGCLWCAPAVLLGRGPWPRIALLALTVGAGLALFMLFQALPAPGFAPVSPIWARAAALLNEPLRATVSIAPGQTLEAIAPTVVPLLLFACAVRVFHRDEDALLVLRLLGLGGTAMALYGILAYALAPDTLVFVPKTSYRDSLTAVFVNRNTAATFFGGTILVLMALAAHDLGRRPALRTLSDLVFEKGRSARDRRILFWIAGILVAGLALGLTRSRAGGASTLLSACVLALVLARPADAGEPMAARLRRLAVNGLMVVVPAALALVFLGARTLQRVRVRGGEDDRFCVYPGMLRAAREVWPLGSGAGTFEAMFSPFRDPACGIYGVWDRAHSFYIEGLVTLGGAFVVALLFGIGGLLWLFRRGLRRRRRFRFAPALGLSLALLLVLHDAVDFSLQISGLAFWAAVAMAAAAAIASHRPFETNPS